MARRRTPIESSMTGAAEAAPSLVWPGAARPPRAEASAGDAPSRRVAANPWARFGWMMAVIWMIFLIYPIIGLVRSDASAIWVVVGWIALAVFAVLYIVGFVRGFRDGGFPGGRVAAGQWAIFAALLGCVALTIPAIRDSALSFVPFVMSFASYGLTRTAHWITTISGVSIAAACVLIPSNGLDNLSILMVILLLGAVNTISTWLIIRSIDAEELGRQLATSEGREAVARDVHDLLGHSLTVVKLKAQLARRLIDTDPARAKSELIAIEALAAEAIQGVRTTVSAAWPSTLPEQLDASTAALRSAGIRVDVRGGVEALSPAQSLTISWILREATTNVLRHADARGVVITLSPGTFALRDDGRGTGVGSGEGNGVRSMRERAAAAGARFTLSSAPGGGTLVEVTW